VTFKYTVAQLQHKAEHYLNVNPSGEASGYDTQPWTGFAPVGVSTLEAEFFAKIAPFYKSTDTTFDSWELWNRTGTIWNFVSGGAASVGPSGAGAAQAANGYCISGKMNGGRRMNRFIYEGSFGTAQKVSSYAGISAASQALVDYYFNPGNTAVDASAFAWFSSKDEWNPTRWLAVVIDTNEKLRRVRGLK